MTDLLGHGYMKLHTSEEAGFTLVELLVAITIGILVCGVGFVALTTADKATRANDLTVETQQNARVAMDILTYDIKRAGFGMDSNVVGNCQVTVGGVAQAAAIVPGDNVMTGVDTGPDRISMVVPTTDSAWTIASPGTTAGFATITLQPGAGSAMVAAGLAVGSTGRNLISIGGLITATVSNVTGDVLTLATAVPPPAIFPQGTPVYLLQCMTYQVIQAPDTNNLCGGTTPCLVRGVTPATSPRQCDVASSPCIPIADGVEDLQFAYACDGCNAVVNSGLADGIIDDQGAVDNAFGNADWVSNNAWSTVPMLPNTIRLVRVGLLVRQAKQDIGMKEASMTSGTHSSGTFDVSINTDHVVTVSGTETQFRRRAIVRTVQTRNLQS